METVMDPIAIARAAISAPVKRRRRFGRRHLALAGLALAVTLGGTGYGRYWWSVGRYARARRPQNLEPFSIRTSSSRSAGT